LLGEIIRKFGDDVRLAHRMSKDDAFQVDLAKRAVHVGAVSFNPQPTARNLTRPPGILCLGFDQRSASEPKESPGINHSKAALEDC